MPGLRAYYHAVKHKSAKPLRRHNKLPSMVESTILTGSIKGEDVLILRTPVIPTNMPFQFN